MRQRQIAEKNRPIANGSRTTTAGVDRPIPRVVLRVESSRASGRALLQGIATYARLHGPWAFVWDPAGLGEARPKLRGFSADGIILRDLDARVEARRLSIPAIVVGHRHPAQPRRVNVVTDSATIAGLAARHLRERGYRHFAFCGFTHSPWSEQRCRAFAGSLGDPATPVHTFVSTEADAHAAPDRELQDLARWLRDLPRPLGLMACNDDRGRHVIEACKLAGLRVPEEVGVVGADNDELVCELSEPPLSSVAINFERAGYESARVLDRLMRGQPAGVETILVQATHLVARQSSNILHIGDAAVAKALACIQAHARTPMLVDQVAAASGVSRRVLEKRFRQRLGRSVLHEIRRVRVEHVCRLLTETNHSVAAIAADLGYPSPEHFARYFRAEKDMTPLDYRRLHGRP